MHKGELADKWCSEASFVVAEELEKVLVPIFLNYGMGRVRSVYISWICVRGILFVI